MKFLLGLTAVFVCTLGGFVLMGGHLSVIGHAAPKEMLVILGTGMGAFFIANPKPVLKGTASSLKTLFKGAPFTKSNYIELLSLMYQIFKLAKTKGMLALETHVDKPDQSSLFSAFPGVLHNHHAVDFFCDYLRLITLGSDKPYELEALMDEELDIHHKEQHAISGAVQNLADALPAIGIVAAVLGVIHTMGSITEPPEILGRLIGGALVGTFMGVWMAYGMVAPIASALKSYLDAESRYIQCIKIGLLAYLQGFAPSISVEYARKTIMNDVRPTFGELEDATQSLPPPPG